MSKDAHPSGESVGLRHRAEKHLESLAAKTNHPPSAAQMERLLHELQVHQIELEMQNQELIESRVGMETALERYTELYDFAPIGYFTLSAEGTIREVNLPGARFLGIERGRLIGDHFKTFVSGCTRPIFDSWFKEVFSTQNKPVCVISLLKKDQSRLVVELNATLSLDGREGRVVAVDITARKAMEEQLQQAQKMEVVGQLAGGVAHDFNNILAAMILNLEMLQLQHELPAEARSSLVDLEALAKRGASLTQQLLLFSRQQAMHLEHLEINAAVADLLKMLERLLGENITCHQLSDKQKLWIEADRVMLDQTVMNICLNARDAMPNGGVLTLEASLVEVTPEIAPMYPESRTGQFVCLRISDTGCGMSTDVLKHLFEPFFTTKEIGKGTGLGLASVYGMIHQHKGWINVESAVEQGTTFRLYFPLLLKTEAPQAEIPRIPSIEKQNGTILLVEDEQALLLMSTRALKMFGYRVLSASNGEEAFKLWEQHQADIDLMVTDMRMPRGMSGLELAEKIWKTNPSFKVIIMSGYSMEIVRDSALGESTYTFLAKPFNLQVLAETVQQCLNADMQKEV